MIKSKKIQIIDNFLDQKDFKTIQSSISGSYFPWYFQDGIINEYDQYNYQFCHNFYDNGNVNSANFEMLHCVFKKLNLNNLIRVKANLRPRTTYPEHSDFHIDFEDVITSIFYVNTNNGKTLFYDGTEIDSIENRMVIFDSNLIHQGVSCTDEKTRIVINFNYY